MTSVFKGIEDAEISYGGFYLEPGIYEVEIGRVFTRTGRTGDPFFVVEMKVLESNNPNRPAGCSPSWVVKTNQDAAIGNIKGFLAAASGIDPKDREGLKQVTAAYAEWASGAENPLAGNRVHVEVDIIKTRKGADFSKHYWSPVEQSE